MTDDHPIAMQPVLRVLLRNKSEAILTHYVAGPEPFELLGRLTDRERTPALWQRAGRFSATLAPAIDKHPLDIVGIDRGDGPWSPFVGIKIPKSKP